jgi:subtilisin family serine protease
MREAGVRVVNMSWGGSVDEMSLDLLQTGLERDPAKARARALAMYEKERAALASAFAAAPEILFVAAAGNENQSDATLGAIPQVIPAPNLLIVGAAGQSGNPTAFTTFGDRVRLYARGEGAAGRTPGGGMGNASGTSMAAPNVARAAAQMLAANPKLTATKLVEGLIMTASDGQNGMKLLHAAEAVRWAKQQQ